MAKIKAGSIAVPFLVSFFIGLLLIGGAGIYLYNYFSPKEEGDKEMEASTVGIATYADSKTVLFILDVPEKKSTTFAVMRAVPKEKKMLFTGIPTNTITLLDGHQTSMLSAYQNGGITMAIKFAETVMDIKIDHYMKLNEKAYLKLSDIFGGVNLAVSANIPGIKSDTEPQYLTGPQSLNVIAYPEYAGGELERTTMATTMITAMINQSSRARIADRLDQNFTSIINLVESDITSADFKARRNGILFLLTFDQYNLDKKKSSGIAGTSTMTGTVSAGNFIVETAYSDFLREEYFKPHKDGK